jgi:hypothetical protein
VLPFSSSDWSFLYCLLRKKKNIPRRAKTTPEAMPIPRPALAPVERPVVAVAVLESGWALAVDVRVEDEVVLGRTAAARGVVGVAVEEGVFDVVEEVSDVEEVDEEVEVAGEDVDVVEDVVCLITVVAVAFTVTVLFGLLVVVGCALLVATAAQ